MTAVLERETLTGVEDETRQQLEAAADAFVQSPANLRAAIVAAGRRGERPAAIARAIRYVYTYDYVARLVREDKKNRAQS